MSDNPFLKGELKQMADIARDEAKAAYEKRLADGRKMIEDADIMVGDLVTVSWKVDDAYGGGIKSHIGQVAEIDSWLWVKPTNKSPGHLRIPISALHHIRIERNDPEPVSDNPFMQAAIAANNPFLKSS